MRGRVRTPLRLLLPVLVILGVAGMHTMGHPHEAHATVSGMYVSTHEMAPDPEPTGPQIRGAHHSGGDLGQMCLAILTALTALLLAASAPFLLGRRLATRRRPDPAPAPECRGPPTRWTPTGVAVTEVTVLRI